jgi:hypothetical protein
MFQVFEAAARAESCNPSAEAQGAPAEGAKLANPGGETPPLRPEKEAHAARLKRFKREQLVVDYLNRGVSVVEIAARIGVGEKRMRAIIREIIARRQPHPPAEFVAIQISRLNEAMLNAYSAMSPKNLKAVAQVVRIVGQLDRYHGFDAADWRRRLERARQNEPADETATYGGALFCSAELALQDDEMERLDLLLEGCFGGLPGRDNCPENLAQVSEKVDFTPGSFSTVVMPFAGRPRESGGPEATAAAFRTERLDLDARVRGHDTGSAFAHGREGGVRSEIPSQGLGTIDSAPGIHTARQKSPAASADLILSPSKDAPARSSVSARASVLRDATHGVAPQHEGGAFPPVAPAADGRPENPSQDLGTIDSAPGTHTARQESLAASSDLILSPSKNAPARSSVSARASGFEMRRMASLLSMRAVGFPRPRRLAAIARKICRNALKRLNPRPEPREPRRGSGTPRWLRLCSLRPAARSGMSAGCSMAWRPAAPERIRLSTRSAARYQASEVAPDRG